MTQRLILLCGSLLALASVVAGCETVAQCPANTVYNSEQRTCLVRCPDMQIYDEMRRMCRCPDGTRFVADGGTCAIVMMTDAGPPPVDAGRDAGTSDTDGGAADAGSDGGPLPSDAGRDAGRDGGRDAGRDAGRDGGRDAGRDAGMTPVDAGRD